MIVQRDSDETGAFVMTMAQHTAFAGSLARHFGNGDFEAPVPRKEMLYLVAHHDDGWRDLDARALRNPDTGLPYHLVETPFEELVKTSSASPAANEREHPFCGLLSSMHSWGLYHGRYGLSDKVLVEALSEEQRRLAEPMLEQEEQRQAALKAELAANVETAPWIETAALLQNYKQLQFFDTLALYFNCAPEARREETVFNHVPLDARRDADVRVTPQGDGVYQVAPWPFSEDELSLSFAGRHLRPAAAGESVRAQLDAAPESLQRVTLQA